ncbi:MAG: hypothetical protein HYS44_00500 [Candidatus Niyogibacteria bacterium]|nr:hypothetical protein [Candidatus Niyogibacteria bacterium]
MTFEELIRKITTGLIDPLVGLMIAAAGIVFLWGVVEFIAKADNEAARAKGKQHIVWGLVGLTIMFTVWGLVRILYDFICSGGTTCAPL